MYLYIKQHMEALLFLSKNYRFYLIIDLTYIKIPYQKIK